jgi:hypothetical protein
VGDNISYQTAEYGKFLKLGADTAFPPISVVRLSYPDTSSAFPQNSGLNPLSSVDVYPKYAVLTHLTNPDDIKISLSAENINVSLDGLEFLAGVQNSIGFLQSYQLSSITSYVDDLEKNTFDTASACDDVYHEAVKLNKTFTDSPNLDAFGRFRTSNPLSLFDYKSIYDNGSFFWNVRLNDATDAFQLNDSSRELTINVANGYLVKETYRRFAYQPGKSQLCMFTGIMEAQLDVIKRSGMFRSLSGNNYTNGTIGIYFESYYDGSMANDQRYAWVINNGSNLVPSQSATQSQWNLDKMDGTGPSGIVLDFSKTQIFLFDFEWLGVGRVRCGFNVNGKTYYCHEFLHANNINGTYMIDPNLPVRHEIRSVGGLGTMKTICCSVMSEGGADSPAYVTRSISLSSGVSTGGNNARRGILGIRLKPSRSDASNEIITIDVLPIVTQQNTFAPFKWELVMRPTPVSGVNWVDVSSSSSIQYAEGGSGVTFTDGTIVATGFSSREATIELNDPLYNKCIRLGRNLEGVTDELWIVVTYFAQHQTTQAAITWGEAD